jgi:menaquinone-specific isochorismate synthase
MHLSSGDAPEGTLISRATKVEAPDPRAVLTAATRPRTVWDAPDEPTVLAEGVAAEVTATGTGRFETVRETAQRLLERAGDGVPDAARPRLFGGFSFHADSETDPPWDGFPDARFVLPRVQLTSVGTGGLRPGQTAWLTVNDVGADAGEGAVKRRLERERSRIQSLSDPGPIAAPPGIESRTRTTSREEWRESVRAAIQRIEAGELRKVVLAQALRTTLAADLSIPDMLARLGETYPDCHRFLTEPPSSESASTPSFFGATPERLVRLQGRTLETGALAGTTGRGETPTEDEWLAEELQNDAKNVHEHELVVDAIRDQIAPFASSVTCGDRSVRRLATIQHLWTPITAELADDEHVLRLVEALHPTPAVGGLPPAAALQTIRETEPFDRGWYAAPIGWFDAAGNGSFAVALRSAVSRDRTATLFAGVGIVADSDPDREWDEVQLKYRPILDELEGTNERPERTSDGPTRAPDEPDEEE